MSHIFNGKLLALSAAVLFVAAFINVTPAFAATNLVPIEIEPICSDAASSQSFWKVTNKNASDIEIDWTNIDNSDTGTFQAPSGLSLLSTSYDGTDPNNTTRFVHADGAAPTQTNATAAQCNALPTPPCVDGNVQNNLVVSIDHGKATIHTLNNAPLCNDVTVNFSSYVMPANYDGNGFYGNTTAYPQTLFDTKQAVLKAGTDGTTELNINLPADCNNVQVDVYYGQTITTVGANGHGTANILSQVYKSTGTCPVVGGQGGGQTTTTTSTSTPAPATPVAQLANTGTSPVAAYLAAIGLAVSTALATIFVRKSNV